MEAPLLDCYHLTRSVAFTRAWAYHESKDRVIATASGSFALNDIQNFAGQVPKGIIND